VDIFQNSFFILGTFAVDPLITTIHNIKNTDSTINI